MTLLGAKFVTKKIDLCELLDDVSGGMAKCPLSPGSIGYQYDFDLAGHPSKVSSDILFVPQIINEPRRVSMRQTLKSQIRMATLFYAYKLN